MFPGRPWNAGGASYPNFYGTYPAATAAAAVPTAPTAPTAPAAAYGYQYGQVRVPVVPLPHLPAPLLHSAHLPGLSVPGLRLPMHPHPGLGHVPGLAQHAIPAQATAIPQNIPPPSAKERTFEAKDESGKSFEDTIGEAKRRAEEARRNMEEEQRKAKSRRFDNESKGEERPPPTEEDKLQLQALLARFSTLDTKALAALDSLDVRDAVKALQELEQKGPGIRNPSAWICKTAQNVRERQGGKAPPPPQEEEKHELDIVDHYGALEVAEDADEKDIKKAYRKLVLKWHPDKHPEGRDQAEEKIRAINNAYETLSNATKRSTYDAQRQALLRQKRGQGPDMQAANLAPRQRIPREFMLQPIGFPDKFVRYASERAMSQCEVNSRADARLDGKGGLDQFVPFFRAAKLSLWWLPDVNNMCRIRALEARTRSSAGEKVVAGRPGGFNLGFEIEVGRDSDLKLMEAGKGELNDNVNFIVVSSPLYDHAFRFEAATKRGYFLAFRPPTSLRMIPYNGGPLPNKMVIDFTLVDFQAMFKFIDIEEVLRPVIEAKGGWVPLDQVKTDANVTAYFGNILQKPMWDDDDFQSYFEGHFEMWEFRTEGPAVRLRGVDERLGYALERVKDADEAAALVISAGEELKRLHWRYILPAFEALQRNASEEISCVVQRMEAHRRLLGAVGTMLQSEADFASLARLARLLQPLTEGHSAKDVAQRSLEASTALAKVVLARAKATESGQLADVVKLEDLKVILSLPGMSSCDSLARITSPPLSEAPLEKILELVSAAASSATPLAREVGHLALQKVSGFGASGSAVTSVVLALAHSGLLLDSCAALLGQRGPVLKAEELASAVAAIGEKGFEGPELVEACGHLGGLGLLPAPRLLGLALAATKSEAVAKVLHRSATLDALEAVRLLLALTKPKNTGQVPEVPGPVWAQLLKKAADVVRPALPELPAAELIRLALAAKSHALEGKELLETVAKEALKRLAELPQAHLLLLTQGLISLGGRHPCLQQICGYWSEVLSEEATSSDNVSKRRKEMERGQSLSGDQVAKLAQVLEPITADVGPALFQKLFKSITQRVQSLARSLPAASRAAILEQVKRGEGIGCWEPGRQKLRQALEKRSRSRKRSSSSSSSRRPRGRGRSSSRSRGSRSRRRR
ncbi:unnamed protein product [Effrenium voratum]|uniref:J domain-containing protein n=1 Tax=Effrenium voratum TaxID=2562239 RepID=A0AA36HQF9_9DINO|nr:unnamed protein product [Effrenium voratum]